MLTISARARRDKRLAFRGRFHVCAETFKSGAIFNVRHIAPPTYIVYFILCVERCYMRVGCILLFVFSALYASRRRNIIDDVEGVGIDYMTLKKQAKNGVYLPVK